MQSESLSQLSARSGRGEGIPPKSDAAVIPAARRSPPPRSPFRRVKLPLRMFIANDEDRPRAALTFPARAIPGRIDAGTAATENGLARLVLAIIELIRRLLEKQALRRMDRGTLTDDEIERLGNALMQLEEKMAELKRAFGLEDDDLNLSLGPVRTLD